MPKIHHLHCELTLDTDLDTAWEFIRSPKNLDLITPDDMSFEIVSPLPEAMYEGLLIEYRVGIPFLGKQTWLSELKHIRDRHSFVDEQLVGPYKLWFHYHEIEAVKGGVRFTDQIRYVMPFGPFGEIARMLYVRKQLEHIFNYRRKAMERHFSGSS
jgi:ligand-binding SRPBCC domain-containing protein